MNQIGITPSFTKSLVKLTNQEQAQIKQVPMDFLLSPTSPGHRLHKLNAREKRFFSISVNMDLRIIVLRDGNRHLFCYVDHHDDAYKWAQRRRAEVHPVTGAAQLVELEEVIREDITHVSREVQAPPVLANEDNGYLLSLGVPQVWLETVKQVDTDGLLEILDRLPEEAAENLFKLADGERPAPSSRHKDTDPFTHPDAQRRFWATSDERALQQALDYPWDQWTVFLHPVQRNVVERNFGGPARISGSAGTGKTVVALHRAVFLANRFDEAEVLLTTYSRPLVERLKEGLNRLVGATGDIRRRIRVEHLHKYAHEVASNSAGFLFTPVRAQELDAYLKRAITLFPNLSLSNNFLRTEFDAVVDYWGIKDVSSYQKIEQSGRGSTMSHEQRTAIWPVFEHVLEMMSEDKRMTWSDLADAGRRLVESRDVPPFNHVVADEAQDFGPREIRFLMSLAPKGAYSHLFTGDSSQRIYRYPFAWSRVGVDLRGRGATLDLNYRMTGQISAFAQAALRDTKSNSDDEFASGEAVSLVSGPSPTVEQCGNAEIESSKLAEWLRGLLEQDFKPGEIAILARTRALLEERVAPALETLGLSANAMGTLRSPQENGIAVGTLHQAKGLEFRAVSIVACDAEFLPHPSAIAVADDAGSRAIAEARERQLFHVGCTRPRDILRISFCKQPSKFLPEPAS